MAIVIIGGSWSPEINDQMQYLQIAFPHATPLFGVIIRGSPIFDQYVTSFKILHSYDGIAFHYLMDETNTPQIFRGPIDSRTPVQSEFKIPIESKVIRIYPLTWHGSIAIRVDLLGCATDKQTTTEIQTTLPTHPPIIKENIKVPLCEDALGLDSGLMKSHQIDVSSIKSSYFGSNKIRPLDMLKLSSKKGWSPNLNTPNEFVVFDFLEPRHLTGFKTKGGEYGWVSGYQVFYSIDNFIWNHINDLNGNTKMFLGNFDSDSIKVNNFEQPINARYLKLIPIKWHDSIELKVEPLGCFKPYRKIFHNICKRNCLLKLKIKK